MFRVFIVLFCSGFATRVLADEQKLLSINNDSLICGSVSCPINTTAMCFYTTRMTKDSKNGTYITSCGTCLSQNGSTVRENCGTEPTTLTNHTDTMSISLVNSTMDQTSFRNGILSLLMNGMATNGMPFPMPPIQVINPGNTNAGPFPLPSPLPVPIPVVSPGTSPGTFQGPYPLPPPVIVVQPPAQQIYFNQPPNDSGFSYDNNRPQRSPNEFCTPPDSPECKRSAQGFRPNQLPPQLDKVYNDIRTMHQTLNRLQATIQDMAAALPIGYLDTSKPYPGKQNFPLFTPPGFL